MAIVAGVCLVTAALALAALTLTLHHPLRPGAGSGHKQIIRFHRGKMVEGDSAFLKILAHRGWDGTPSSLKPFFAFRFRGLPRGFPEDTGTYDVEYSARDPHDDATVVVVRRNGSLTLFLSSVSAGADIEDHVTRYRMHTQWMTRWVARASHNPVWICDREDEVIWSNRAYHKLAQDLGQSGEDERSILLGLDPQRSLPDREQRRFHLKFDGRRPDHWIDVTEDEQRGMRLFHAVDVTAVVQAEIAQRTFVQTLAKTFAQLSIGLAIFDRSRQLALFNPALVDLTGLSAEFLSARPGYLSFFDKLREGSIMPEPRSYATWRERIFDLIAAAEDGRYQETWTLPSGQTYRVTGRPHPNGAVAFLVEDISAEVTLTRRFREQLDLSHSVIESLDQAVAVFSPQGMLSYTNRAYGELWGMPHGKSPMDLTVNEASHHWQEQCEANPVWGDFRDFVVDFDERADWEAVVKKKDGRPIDCRFRPLNGGATLATFRAAGALQAVEYEGVG